MKKVTGLGRGLIGVALLSVMLLVSGCSKKESLSDKAGTTASYDRAMSVTDKSTASSVKNGTEVKPAAADVKNEEAQVKKIIQTGEVRIVVDDLKATSKEIRAKAEEMEGYIESETLNEYNSSAKVRIPSDKVTEFIGFLEGKYNVEGKNTASQDVTDVYVDNDARLKNLKVQEAQYQEIMKSAKTIDEILKVQNELSKVRGDIESLEAKKKNWDRDVNYSTINVSSRKAQLAIESKVRVLNRSDFGKAIIKGFTASVVSIALFLQRFTIFVLSNIIQLLLLAAAVIVGFKLYKKYYMK